MGRPRGSKNKNPSLLEDRFWAKVDKQGENGCWNWTAFIHPSGYGTIAWNRRMHHAHRISWMIHFGEIPKDILVCHHCDNPPCCNPDHLFLGTHKDNSNDRDSKMRGVVPDNRGEKHGQSKLKSDDVLEIRRLCSAGKLKKREIASMFGISISHVRRIYKKIAWSWLEQ